jgi:hypothetical protein
VLCGVVRSAIGRRADFAARGFAADLCGSFQMMKGQHVGLRDFEALVVDSCMQTQRKRERPGPEGE